MIISTNIHKWLHNNRSVLFRQSIVLFVFYLLSSVVVYAHPKEKNSDEIVFIKDSVDIHISINTLVSSSFKHVFNSTKKLSQEAIRVNVLEGTVFYASDSLTNATIVELVRPPLNEKPAQQRKVYQVQSQITKAKREELQSRANQCIKSSSSPFNAPFLLGFDRRFAMVLPTQKEKKKPYKHIVTDIQPIYTNNPVILQNRSMAVYAFNIVIQRAYCAYDFSLPPPVAINNLSTKQVCQLD